MIAEDYCPVSGKFRYPSEARIQSVFDVPQPRTPDSHPRDYYWCDACDAWHLTSQPRGASYRRKVRRKRVRFALTGDE